MIERSRRLIVCADSSKWGVVGLSAMAQLSEASVLVTDSGLSAQASGVFADHVSAWVEEMHPGVDVVVYDGGQERYPLLLSVE